MKELDRRKFLKGAATGVLVGGLGFDTATLSEPSGRKNESRERASGYSSAGDSR